MRYIVLGMLSLACVGCMSMAMERSAGNLQAVSALCVGVAADQVQITQRQEDVSQVAWTALGGQKVCRCVQRTISSVPATCVPL